MQIVEALADADVLDAGGQEAYTLQAGCRYVVYGRRKGVRMILLNWISLFDHAAGPARTRKNHPDTFSSFGAVSALLACRVDRIRRGRGFLKIVGASSLPSRAEPCLDCH